MAEYTMKPTASITTSGGHLSARAHAIASPLAWWARATAWMRFEYPEDGPGHISLVALCCKRQGEPENH
jgi:hypothetical protein